MPDRRSPAAVPRISDQWHAAPDGPALSADLVLRLARERDHLFLLHEASAAAERCATLGEKLHTYLSAVLRVGFHRGTISVRDAQLEQTALVAAGLSPEEEAELRKSPSPGAVWRHRLEQLEPHRISYSYYLDSRDPWVAGEFGNAVPSALPARAGADWSPRDALLVPLHGAGGNLVGLMALDDPVDRARPTIEQVRTVELYASQIAIVIERARLQKERDREQRLSGAIADVARAVNESLQPAEVRQIVVRHARAMLNCEGATLALFAGDLLHCVAGAGTGSALQGLRVPPSPVSAEAIRTRRAVVSNDYLRAADPDGPILARINPNRVLIAPLVSRTGPVGLLAAFGRPNAFTDADADFLQRMADQVAMAVVNATLFEEMTALAERYQRVVETTRDAIVITDRSRAITFTNPAADRLFGIAAGTPPDREALVPPEERGEVFDRETRALSGEPQSYESVIRQPTGERRLVIVSNAPLYERGDITGIVATLRDVTDERAARDELARSEARYRNLFETASDAIYTLDATGAFTTANHATCVMVGLPREALLGRPVRELVDPEDVERTTDSFLGALAGQARRYECHFRRPDGTQRLVSVTSTPLRDGDTVVAVLGIARDVTDERQRKAALARSQARYTRLVESASDIIFTTDVSGRLTSVNRAMERAFGLPRGRLLERVFVDLLPDGDRSQVDVLLRETATGTRCQGQLRFHAPDGETRHGSLLATPIYEDGVVAGILVIVRDVTDERRLSEQLLQQEKLAAIGELVSGVAHELNNPLAAVVAFSELLMATETPPDQRRAIDAIHAEARRAARIVTNLLTFSRQRQPERALTDLNRILESTLELRRYALRTLGVEVDLRLDPDLAITWADPHQLQQVLMNLVANAEHALTEWSGPRALILETRQRDAILQVRVADSGPGILPEHLSRIFNPFFTTKDVGRGTGLGLSISHGIVREHGGRIFAHSVAGHGATFTVELPFVPPPRAAAPPRVEEAAAVPGKRVLIADDEPAIRSATATFLRSLGYVVDTASGGEEALHLLQQARYDAVLLDVRMPGLTGDGVYLQLERTDPDHARRVVFITGDIPGESVRRQLDATARPVLMKPFLLDALGALVAETVRAA